MCLFGRLKWSKLPVYWIAQFLGAFVGAAILYFTYFGMGGIQLGE